MVEKPRDVNLPDADRRTLGDMVETKIRIPSQELRKRKVAVASSPGRNRERIVGRADVCSEADDGDRARQGRTQGGVCQRGTEEVAVEVVETCGRDLVDDGGLGAGEVRGAVNGDVLRTCRGWCFGVVQLGAAGEDVSFG